MALDVLEHRQRTVERDAVPDDLVAELEQRGIRGLIAAVANRCEDAELQSPREHLGAFDRVDAKAPAELPSVSVWGASSLRGVASDA